MVPRRRRADAVLALVGLGLGTAAAAVADRHPALERRVFERLNHPRAPYRLLAVFQQLGTPWALPATGAVALVLGRPRLALAAALAVPLEKAVEVGLKKARPTHRPLWVMPTVLRGDAPTEGESFPSGHAALAFTTVSLTAPYVPRPLTAGMAAAAAVGAATRVHQGAHHPVDSLAGAGLGVGIGAGLGYLVGRDP